MKFALVLLCFVFYSAAAPAPTACEVGKYCALYIDLPSQNISGALAASFQYSGNNKCYDSTTFQPGWTDEGNQVYMKSCDTDIISAYINDYSCARLKLKNTTDYPFGQAYSQSQSVLRFTCNLAQNPNPTDGAYVMLEGLFYNDIRTHEATAMKEMFCAAVVDKVGQIGSGDLECVATTVNPIRYRVYAIAKNNQSGTWPALDNTLLNNINNQFKAEWHSQVVGGAPELESCNTTLPVSPTPSPTPSPTASATASPTASATPSPTPATSTDTDAPTVAPTVAPTAAPDTPAPTGKTVSGTATGLQISYVCIAIAFFVAFFQ